MPVEVEAPDGSVVEFPDGTPPATMREAMRRRFGGPFSERPYNENEARAATIARGGTLALNDEILGAGDAIATGARELAAGRNPLPAAGEAFNRTSTRTRALTERYRRERPVGGVADEVAGGLLTFGLPNVARAVTDGTTRAMGQIVQRAPEFGRGISAFLGQTARGAGTGALAGYAYGLGDRGTPVQRLQAANQGAVLGGAIGAVTPAAVNAVGAVARPVGRALSRVGPPPRSQFGAGPMVSLRPPPERPSINPAAMGTIDRLADRARMTPDDVEAAFRGARANPQGQVTADIFGPTGVRTLRPIVQGPGRSGDFAAKTARTRIREAPERIMRALSGGLNVGESRHAALARLQEEYRTVGAEMYRPVFAQEVTAQQRQALDDGLRPLLGAPVMQRAARRVERLFATDRAAGLVDGEADSNLARYLHYLKLSLDESIGQGRRSGAMQATEMRGAMEIRNQLLRLMDENLPGYGAARGRWAGLAEAEDALDTGAKWLRMMPEEVQAARQTMSPFALMHARIGLADEIRTLTRGKVVGNQNVGARLDDPDMQRAIAAAFDDPAQAAAFLDTVNTQNELAANALQWGGGSQTFANVAFGADEALNAGLDAAGSLATGQHATAARQGAGAIWNAVRGGAVERANNARGEALLRRIDTEEADRFAREVVAELRRRQTMRATNSAAAQAAAPVAAQQTANRRRD